MSARRQHEMSPRQPMQKRCRRRMADAKLVAWHMLSQRRFSRNRESREPAVYARVCKISGRRRCTANGNETEARIAKLGIVLPALPQPAGITFRRRRSGSIVYLAGVISTNSEGVITGTVGRGSHHRRGLRRGARLRATQLAVLKRHLGSLDAVKSIVSVNGYVNAVAGFPDSPKVINGASDLLDRSVWRSRPPRARGDRRFRVAAQRARRVANDRRTRGIESAMAESLPFRRAHAFALESRSCRRGSPSRPATRCIWNAWIPAARRCIPA